MSAEIEPRPAKARMDRLRNRRRKEILTAAAEVFSKKGFHQTRISDIITTAGIARGTFYLYFESKGSVFIALLHTLLRKLRSSVIGVDMTPGAAPMEDQLVQTVERVLRAVSQDKAMATIVVREAVSLDAEAREILHDFYRNLHEFIADSIATGQSLGVVRDVDVNVVAACVLGTVKQVMENYVLSNFVSSKDISRDAKAIVAFNMHGLLPAQ